jgi:hypothetical protein
MSREASRSISEKAGASTVIPLELSVMQQMAFQ